MKFLIALFLFFTYSLQAQEGYADKLHHRASEYVKKVSDYADDKLVSMADYIDNKEVNVSNANESTLKSDKDSVDTFFLNNKYLDETDSSYVSLRPTATLSTKESDKFDIKVSAHLALSKAQKRFKFFINDLNKDNAKKIITDNKEEEQSAPALGINYFAPENYGIESKYSLGIRGIFPFTRARYSMEFHPGSWIIEPIQEFEYTLEDEFREETDLFLDTKITNLTLFRLYLSRGTKNTKPGMSYNASVSLFYTPSKNLGLSFLQYVNGSTKYQHAVDEDADPVIYEDYNGIYNYGTSITLRQNVWRPWFFYELEPGVNFHKQFDYEPNYTLRILFDIFIEQI